MMLVTHAAAETQAVAEEIGRALRPGDIITLAGDLGSGKTTFAQGLARGLDVTDVVVSPTFTLMRRYEGRIPLVHCDMYRLDHFQELHDLGFDELVDGEVVLLIEWGDVVSAALPSERLDIRLEPGGAADDDRIVSFDARGPSWDERRDALAGAAGPRTSDGT